MEFVVIAQYRVRAGEEDKVEAALREMVAPTRAEPGNLDYQVFRASRTVSGSTWLHLAGARKQGEPILVAIGAPLGFATCQP